MVRVLVLDDSAVARAAATRAVLDLGMTSVPVATVEDGAALDPTTLAAAVLDVDVGAGSGIDLALQLREKDPDLPIAFLTATNDEDARSKASSIGPVFSKTEGIAALQAWISAAARRDR